jgi:hypothetical protein
MNDMMNEGVMKQEKRAETNYNCRVSSTSERKKQKTDLRIWTEDGFIFLGLFSFSFGLLIGRSLALALSFQNEINLSLLCIVSCRVVSCRVSSRLVVV